MDAYGSLDELVCLLGWLGLSCPEGERARIARWQQGVMRVLAGLGEGASHDDLVDALEADIDALLPEPPSHFVMSGANEASCRAHLARVVCREAERRTVAALGHDCRAVPVLNRLADALFALAVALAKQEGDGSGPP